MTDFASLEARVSNLEGRIERLEISFSMMERSLGTFGDYKNRTDEELEFIDKQIVIMMETLDSVISNNMHQTDLVRAKALKARLKNNQTRARKAKEVK
ncbi:hypothetical protein [Aeromonas salmonicida]|uniref:hypothetical protein n=1 Tax=Aeromonas salmonicida TaxID=645 RepID=UPI00283A8FF5|nr:hypothetical protein [Aeromonas salmonicida]